jgi:prepilin-type N-terminal cleavage/methylation domain-containing protein/prepilin-type processing-associated H-X9-DG protein
MKTSHSLLRVRLFRIGLEACPADFSAGARPGSSRRQAQARKVAHIATQTGFTLIELLVVIVSVAILSAIVFSAAKSASRSAKSVKAVSNLKQIGVMVTSYAGDNNNRIPCYIDWDAYNNGQPRDGKPPELFFFQRTLAEYADAGYQYDYSSMRPLPECFYDPSIDGNPLPQHPMGAFGVNAAILPRAAECLRRFGSSLGVPVTRISRPNVKVICCSAVEVGSSSSWFIDGETFAENGYNPTRGPQPRNAGGAASLFADGHVEKLNVANMDQATRRRYFLPDP